MDTNSSSSSVSDSTSSLPSPSLSIQSMNKDDSSLDEIRNKWFSVLSSLTADQVLTKLDENDSVISSFTLPVLSLLPYLNPYILNDFSIDDETDTHYIMPRYIHSADTGAIYALTLHYNDIFGALLEKKRQYYDTLPNYINYSNHNTGLNILDIGTSWCSYYPEEIEYNTVIGIGMNEHELQRNGQLTKSFVYNVNSQDNITIQYKNLDSLLTTMLSDDNDDYAGNSTNSSSSSVIQCKNYFDIITFPFNIQYLQYPIELFQILQSYLSSITGIILISFSNRLLVPSKTIHIWKNEYTMDKNLQSNRTSTVETIEMNNLTSSTSNNITETLDTTDTNNNNSTNLYRQIGLVISFLHYSGYTNIETFDLSPSNYTDQLYIVQATKKE